MPIQCPGCQKINRDSAKFCDSCGANLNENFSAPRPEPQKVSSRPDSLPEKPTRSYPRTIQPQTQVRIPKIKSGPTFGAWILFILIIIGANFGIFFLMVDSIGGAYEEFESFLIQGIFLFIIGLFVFLKIAKSKVYLGVVTHLERYMAQDLKPSKSKTIPNLMFNLQQTNKDWAPLKDNQGFLKPILEIAFRSNKVHGDPLEEGTRVILKGQKQKEQIRAKEIWNLSSKIQSNLSSQSNRHWGRVIQKAPSRALPDLRYPGQGKTIEVWEFRLQPSDPNFDQLSRDHKGDLLVALPVEIRAISISGPLNEGDKVEITGQVLNNILYARHLINHSAGGAELILKEPAGMQ